jgi:zinc protease
MLAGFEYEKQNPGKIAGKALFGKLYGDHPYAHPATAPREHHGHHLRSCARFHAKAYTGGNAVIALVGDLSRAEAEAIAAQVPPAAWPGAGRTAQPADAKAGLTHIDFPSKQTHLMLAELGIDRQDPDWPALSLGNQILGGGAFGPADERSAREAWPDLRRVLGVQPDAGTRPVHDQPANPRRAQRRHAQAGAGHSRRLPEDGPTQQELDDAKRELAGSFRCPCQQRQYRRPTGRSASTTCR